jgi:hypothetical protein
VDVDTFYVGFFGGFIFLQLVNFCAQLEYDNERSGDFSPLKYLPPNKVAVLGIVTTKSPKASYLAEFIMTDQSCMTSWKMLKSSRLESTKLRKWWQLGFRLARKRQH